MGDPGLTADRYLPERAVAVSNIERVHLPVSMGRNDERDGTVDSLQHKGQHRPLSEVDVLCRCLLRADKQRLGRRQFLEDCFEYNWVQIETIRAAVNDGIGRGVVVGCRGLGADRI